MIGAESHTTIANARTDMSMAYFATDGNYGSAEDLLLLDVSNWTADDWQEVDDAGDNERVNVALAISERYGA